MEWLKSQNFDWFDLNTPYLVNRHYFVIASEAGNLEIMKWLRSEGCPWNAATCSGAASNGHLDVLKWVIDNGCPYEVNKYTNTALESLGLA